MILNILNNPIRLIGGFAIKTLIRVFGLPQYSFSFFNVLYTSVHSLARTVGVIQSLRVVWHIGRHLGVDFARLRSILTGNTTLNQFIVQTILTAIQPFWLSTLMKNKRLGIFFRFWFKLTFISFFFTGFKFIFKILMSLVLSSVGILWNDWLSGFQYLKIFADYMSEFLLQYFNFNIPLPNLSFVKKHFNFVKGYVDEYYGVAIVTILAILGVNFCMDLIFPKWQEWFPFLGYINYCVKFPFYYPYYVLSYFSWRFGGGGGAGGAPTTNSTNNNVPVEVDEGLNENNNSLNNEGVNTQLHSPASTVDNTAVPNTPFESGLNMLPDEVVANNLINALK